MSERSELMSERSELMCSIDPKTLICPISRCIFYNPVIADDGQTYEETEIRNWFKTSHISPKTGKVLMSKKLVSNFLIKSIVSDYLDKNPELKCDQYIISDLAKLETWNKHLIGKCKIIIDNPFIKYFDKLQSPKFEKLMKKELFVKTVIDWIFESKLANEKNINNMFVQITKYSTLNCLKYLYDKITDNKINDQIDNKHLDIKYLLLIALDFHAGIDIIVWLFDKCVDNQINFDLDYIEHRLYNNLPLIKYMDSKIKLDFNKKNNQDISAIEIIRAENKLLRKCEYADIIKLPCESIDELIAEQIIRDKSDANYFDDNMILRKIIN